MKTYLMALMLLLLAGTAMADGECKSDCERRARACRDWCDMAGGSDKTYQKCTTMCESDLKKCGDACGDQ